MFFQFNILYKGPPKSGAHKVFSTDVRACGFFSVLFSDVHKKSKKNGSGSILEELK